MGILWFNDRPKEGVATITKSNITLNKAATTYFENADNIMLGYDVDNNFIIIRPLTKEESLRRDSSQTQKYRITVRPSYARVSNKAFINEIIEKFNLNIDNDTFQKFKTFWDAKTNLLKIDLSQQL